VSSPGTGDAGWRERLLDAPTTVAAGPTVSCHRGKIGGVEVVAASWDFAHHGGSFGAADADAFVIATDVAGDERLPLVTHLRTGGTRLTEGVRALVGIPRTTLALQRFRSSGLAHVSVADHPTTGGVWVSIGSRADIRIAVEGALVGFSGPRAAKAMTGRERSASAGSAEAAYDAGLVDLVVDAGGVKPLLGRVLRTLAHEHAMPVAVVDAERPPARDGWDQVMASRSAERPGGGQLLDRVLTDTITLRGRDESVVVRIGRLAGRRVVAVALAATREAMPAAAGFALLRRAADLAGSLDLGLVVLVDTPGADPHTERDGLSAAIGDAMSAVLNTPAPTVSLVHGAGGSGGALAGAVSDVVGVGPHGWFAALSPEGAAATLRITPDDAARVMNLTPGDLLADGFADAFVPDGHETAWLATTLDRLRERAPAADRIARRHARWSAGLPARS
jgi:acetyl-CoA carboxylase carboxyl transferase subunit beta